MTVNQVNLNGEELINLTADTVSEDTLFENVTAHDASGKQITGKFVPYNPNLLINYDFSINQRGQSEYTERGYTVDGWRNTGAASTLIEDGIVHVSATGGNGWYEQALPKEFDRVEGQPLTATICMADGTIVTASGICPPRVENQRGLFIVAKFPNSSSVLQVYRGAISDEFSMLFHVKMVDGGNEQLKRAKLELGEIQTLAHQNTDGNWVLNDPPPNPAVELAKCQRYFIPPQFVTTAGYAATANALYFMLPLPTPMRIRPSLLENSVVRLHKVSDNSILVDNLLNTEEYTLYVAATDNTKQVILGVNKVAHGLNPQDYYLSFIGTTGGFSAEL